MTACSGRTLAQAKINLALRVLGRAEDGYHAVETVFLRLELGDDVRLKTGGSGRRIRCEGVTDTPPERNLAYRAAVAFADETGWPDGFQIEIEKRIPVGGGLGGGSADAAAVLRILNRLAPTRLSRQRFLELAGRVGSDVPFLASDFVMALGWGRGEKMTELAPLPATDVQLIVPPFAISTTEAYAALDRLRGEAGPRPPRFTVEMFRSWHDTAANSVNDFEDVVRERYVEAGLGALLSNAAARGGSLVRMTGSGSTIFVVQDVAPVDRSRPSIPRSSRNTPALGLARVSINTKIITTRTATSVVPVEILG